MERGKTFAKASVHPWASGCVAFKAVVESEHQGSAQWYKKAAHLTVVRKQREPKGGPGDQIHFKDSLSVSAHSTRPHS